MQRMLTAAISLPSGAFPSPNGAQPQVGDEGKAGDRAAEATQGVGYGEGLKPAGLKLDCVAVEAPRIGADGSRRHGIGDGTGHGDFLSSSAI